MIKIKKIKEEFDKIKDIKNDLEVNQKKISKIIGILSFIASGLFSYYLFFNNTDISINGLITMSFLMWPFLYFLSIINHVHKHKIKIKKKDYDCVNGLVLIHSKNKNKIMNIEKKLKNVDGFMKDYLKESLPLNTFDIYFYYLKKEKKEYIINNLELILEEVKKNESINVIILYLINELDKNLFLKNREKIIINIEQYIKLEDQIKILNEMRNKNKEYDKTLVSKEKDFLKKEILNKNNNVILDL